MTIDDNFTFTRRRRSASARFPMSAVFRASFNGLAFAFGLSYIRGGGFLRAGAFTHAGVSATSTGATVMRGRR